MKPFLSQYWLVHQDQEALINTQSRQEAIETHRQQAPNHTLQRRIFEWTATETIVLTPPGD
jgi:hypothetical protein